MICQTHRFYNNRLLFIFFSIFVGFITVAGVLGATRNPVADFDGDGKSDISVYRPSNGFWYIAKSSGGYSFVSWGISTDTPVPGDYDGDGKTDVAVFRPSNGVWYLQQSSKGFRAEQFGLSGDVPIPNVFVRSLYSINFPGY